MLDYRSFCYLQNHKTGCTFVEKFLRKFSNQPIIKYRKHAALSRKNYRADKFYFVNVRNPVDSYWSLFNYGLDRRGGIYLRLTLSGYRYLYKKGAAGFDEWVSFVTEPKNSRLFGRRYTEQVASQFGLMSWRFLRLASCEFEDTAPLMTVDDRCKAAQNLFVNKVLRTETLREDLSETVSNELAPYIIDLSAAIAWIQSTKDINTSTERSEEFITTSARTKIRSREEYLYSKFYPESL